jgi:glycosyltransferase involved in cell wall biosynthesis
MPLKRESKRIVFLIGSMGKGGAERVISVLANSYAAKGWKVDILLLLNSICEYQLNKNINLIPICNENKSRLAQLPKWLFGIRKYVKENKPDKIVSFIARINIITIIACLGLNRSIIISERNDPRADGRSIFVRFGTHLLYPLVNKIVFQTKWAQSCFSSRIQKKSVVIPNPIQVTTKASKIKEKKIVAVGRLVEQKNHAMLIRAFKKVHEKFPDYKLYIYGEGKLRNTLQEQIKDLKLTDAVFLPGNVTSIHESIADAEMFVLSSDYEGLSNALLEAMMMGLPCISTNCAGSNEIISNNYNGILVSVDDEEQLSKAICDLINDKEKAFSLSQNAKRTLCSMNIDKVISLWEKAIEC